MHLNGNNRKRKGSETVEFAFVLLPLLGFVFVTLDIAWVLFVQGTLQFAVRTAVRYGVTNEVPANSNLTAEVKDRVQANALGLLRGAPGRSKIKVYYYEPNTSSGVLTDVSGSAYPDGNKGGNLMVVSVKDFTLVPLLPRVYNSGAENSPMTFSVEAADQIEPKRDPPPKGVAP